MAAAGASYEDEPATQEADYEDDQQMSPSSEGSLSEAEEEKEMTDQKMVETVASIFKHISTWQGLSAGAIAKLSSLVVIWRQLKDELTSAGHTVARRTPGSMDRYTTVRSDGVDKALGATSQRRSRPSRLGFKYINGSVSTPKPSGMHTISEPTRVRELLQGPPILRRLSTGAGDRPVPARPAGLPKPRKKAARTGSRLAPSGGTGTRDRTQ